MGIFKFGKNKEISLEVKDTETIKPLSYLKEDVSSKLNELNANLYNEEEAKRQMVALIERLPVTKQEQDFRDDLRRELYLMGYERSCDIGEEDLADEIALTDLEVSIFERINKALLTGKIQSVEKKFVQDNIVQVVDRIKVIIVDEKVHADLEKREAAPVDIVSIIEQLKEEEKNEDRE